MLQICATRRDIRQICRLVQRCNLAVLFVVALASLTACSVLVDEEINRANVQKKTTTTANDSYIAFTTHIRLEPSGKPSSVTLVYDLQQKNWSLYASPLREQWFFGAKLSVDDPDVMFAVSSSSDEHPKVKDGPYKIATRTLFKCQLDERRCKPVLSGKQRMAQAIDVPGEGILYVGSDPYIRVGPWSPKPYIAYRQNDFYLIQPSGETKRLSHMSYAYLTSVSIANGRLIFSASGPNQSRLLPPEMLPPKRKRGGGVGRSEIFEIDITKSISEFIVDRDIYEPIVQLGTAKRWSIDMYPSTVSGSPYIAFYTSDRSLLKGEKPSKGYQYSIAIYDTQSDTLIDTIAGHDNRTMSNPTMTKDGYVVYFDYYDYAYHIKKYSIAKRATEDVGSIAVLDILRAERKSFTIER